MFVLYLHVLSDNSNFTNNSSVCVKLISIIVDDNFSDDVRVVIHSIPGEMCFLIL